jgi:enoyl-CoA hydratase
LSTLGDGAEGVATIKMDGKVNVMCVAMLQDLGAAFRRAEKDAAIIVLRSGRKDIFSRGRNAIDSGPAARPCTAFIRMAAEVRIQGRLSGYDSSAGAFTEG